MAAQKGLWIDGKPIERNDHDFQTVLKYALVAPEKQDSPAFHSSDIGEVLSLVDDLSVEIAIAMIGDADVAHEFADPVDMSENIALRKGVIAAMQAICAGEIDGDYVEAEDGVPPTLGYLKNLEVLLTSGARTGKGILTKELPFVSGDEKWAHLPDNDSWAGFVFMQNSGVPLSEALSDITPFRGECAGALQLAILLGCRNGVGAQKLDRLVENYGPAFIGAWSMPVEGSDDPVHTLASRFLTQLHKVATTYTRGTVIAVPGDYLYFENKGDYALRAPTGGWRGENCIYMGQDSLGRPHYSGLGLAWKTEFALRMFLGNAYMTDTNTDYLKQRRSGRSPEIGPAIVEDPQAQVRFTARAVMRCPDATDELPPAIRPPKVNPAPLGNLTILKRLDHLGFRKVGENRFEQSQIILSKLMEALEIGDSEMLQAPSSAMETASLVVKLGSWTLRIEPLDPEIKHLSAADTVLVHAVR